MTTLYVISWIILLLILAYYVVLTWYLRGNIVTAINISLGKLNMLTPREQDNFANSMKRGAKSILLDQSALMLVSAGLFAILLFSFSLIPSAICAGMAVFDYCHYKSINV